MVDHECSCSELPQSHPEHDESSLQLSLMQLFYLLIILPLLKVQIHDLLFSIPQSAGSLLYCSTLCSITILRINSSVHENIIELPGIYVFFFLLLLCPPSECAEVRCWEQTLQLSAAIISPSLA